MLDDGGDPELPVAVLRPGRLRGQASATRGDLGRWAHAHARGLRRQRFGGVVVGTLFAAALLATGHAADRAERDGAATAIAPAAFICDGAPAEPWPADAGDDEAARAADGDHLGGVLRWLAALPAPRR